MLIPKKARKLILTHLFNEGVIVAKKDFSLPKHPDIDVANLYVINLMKSYKSKSFVTETFNWQYYYFYLTNEGIEHLRGYLHLPEEIVPATLKKPRTQARPTTERAPRPERAPRRAPGEGEKKLGAPAADFKPEFRGRGGVRREGGAPGGRDSYRREGGGRGAAQRQ